MRANPQSGHQQHDGCLAPLPVGFYSGYYDHDVVNSRDVALATARKRKSADSSISVKFIPPRVQIKRGKTRRRRRRWVNQNHHKSKHWVHVIDPEDPFQEVEGGIKVPSGAGKRLIVNHIGGSHGFLHPCEDVFVGESASGDYHRQMNIEHFLEWFELCVVQKVPDKTVIVLDNAKYHNAFTEGTKNPTTAWRKARIQEWLSDQNVEYDVSMIRPQLLELARMHRLEPVYKTDVIAEQEGRDIKVIRLPIGHCELNPIEMIWAQVKRLVAERNWTFKLVDLLELTREELRKVTAEDWVKVIEHVEKVEQMYWEKDFLVDVQVEELMVPAETDSSSDDEK